MTGLSKVVAAVALTASIFTFSSTGAEAYYRDCYYRGCGQWAGWGWGPWGPAVGWGQGNPYFYGPQCGWVRTRMWHNGHRVVGRAWRCR